MARKKYVSPNIKQNKNVKDASLLDIDVYGISHTKQELQKIRRTLAKRANQRMLRLERATSAHTGEKFDAFGAIEDARQYLSRQKEGKKRFSEGLKAIDDGNKLKREITVLQGFLGRKSSTVSGMRDIERKRLDTFESGKWGKKYQITGVPNEPLHFASTKEFYNFLNSETYKGLMKTGFTSEQLVELYDSARIRNTDKDDGELVSQMKEALAEYREKGNANIKDIQKRLGVNIMFKGK